MSDKKIQRFLDRLPDAKDARRNWLIDREAEHRISGCSAKEAKTLALEEWTERQEKTTNPDAEAKE